MPGWAVRVQRACSLPQPGCVIHAPAACRWKASPSALSFPRGPGVSAPGSLQLQLLRPPVCATGLAFTTQEIPPSPQRAELLCPQQALWCRQLHAALMTVPWPQIPSSCLLINLLIKLRFQRRGLGARWKCQAPLSPRSEAGAGTMPLSCRELFCVTHSNASTGRTVWSLVSWVLSHSCPVFSTFPGCSGDSRYQQCVDSLRPPRARCTLPLGCQTRPTETAAGDSHRWSEKG